MLSTAATVTLVVVAVAVLAAMARLVWRHQVGVSIESGLRAYDEPSALVPVRPTSDKLAA